MICKHDIIGLTQLEPFDFLKHNRVNCYCLNNKPVESEIFAKEDLWRATIRLNGNYYSALYVNCYGINHYMLDDPSSNIVSSKAISNLLLEKNINYIYFGVKPC